MFRAKPPTPRFPLTYGMDGVEMTLHADGRIEGDADAWGRMFATKTVTIDSFDAVTPMLFLLWREMVRQQQK